MSNVAINIAAEFTGKKAFKQADKTVTGLTRNVKKLGFAMGAAFSFRGASRAVKAFAEDDRAAKSLGQTLKNLNLAYGNNANTINGYISRLEKQTGVLDDELRPAMDRFLRATMSVEKSQELLNLALDVSRGTGKSLTQVSQSLQKAYLGQTQALGRLGVGLSKAELTSSSFEEISARLSVLFAGQASAAADTYAGQLDKLTVAGNNAKETIGKGLVDALILASGSQTIDPILKGIDAIALKIAALAKETGKFIAVTKELFQLNLFLPKGGFKGMGNVSMTVGSQDTQKADAAARAKAAAAAKAQANALISSQKKTLKLQQDATKLAKARALFDMSKIQIEAALKGKITEEERIRLKLMQAIEAENITQIEKYTKLLDEAQKKTIELREVAKTLNPFSTWVGSIESSVEALKTLRGEALYIAQLATPISGQYDPRVLTAGQRIDQSGAYTSFNPEMAKAGMTSSGQAPVQSGAYTSFNPEMGSAGMISSGQASVVNNVTVNAGVGDPEAIARVIEDTLNQASYRGTRGLFIL